MMIRPNNWDQVQERSYQKIPVGAYVCKIKKAEVRSESWGEQLCILFDIEDGDYSGYYAKEYRANTKPDKKWKGVLRYFLPTDDGSEQDEWTKSTFKGLTTALERSNNGYQFDWNEVSLAHKLIGILYRNEEWEYKGKTGWTARPFRAISIASVWDGDYTIPKDKPLKGKSVTSMSDSAMQNFDPLDGVDDDLPF